MDAFKLLLLKGKKVDCLEDLGALTIKELKHILVQYRQKTSSVKVDLILCAYAVFCHAKNINPTKFQMSPTYFVTKMISHLRLFMISASSI